MRYAAQRGSSVKWCSAMRASVYTELTANRPTTTESSTSRHHVSRQSSHSSISGGSGEVGCGAGESGAYSFSALSSRLRSCGELLEVEVVVALLLQGALLARAVQRPHRVPHHPNVPFFLLHDRRFYAS